jgi:phosphate-selective porin OprO/OprP
MKIKCVCLLVLLLCGLIPGMNRISLADERALEETLELLREKGVLSTEEVESIKKSMSDSRGRPLERQKEIEEKETGQAGDTYQNRFCLSPLKEDSFSLCLGTLLQADYRYFDYKGKDPAKNKFDLRRVRFLLRGQVFDDFTYKLECEFEGAGSRNLLDAYTDIRISPGMVFRVGQFKEPFSLENFTKDKDLFFAERSMGYYLTPQRDVGFMAHGSLSEDRINYAIGIFNGDGQDDVQGGDVDAPEFCARLVLTPLNNTQRIPIADYLQVGASFGYARIDRNNVNIHVKTTGLTEFFDVASQAKFNIIREADYRRRTGAELGWANGSLAFMAEYIQLSLHDVETSADKFDIDLKDAYGSFLWMITGESPTFQDGILQPVKPLKGISQDGWGGIGLAFRYDKFRADGSVYDYLVNAGDSVREAEAYSVAVNWYLNSNTRVILDGTQTTFDRPLLVDRDSLTGETIYSDREEVVTVRFQLEL